jgi:hypothetical protein
MMKDALLDSIETAILAIWKDESLTIPNKAARRLFHPGAELTSVKDGYDLVSKWHVWDETFTIRMDPSEHPISHLVRTQSPFSSRKIGIHDPETGRMIFLDCLFKAIRRVQFSGNHFPIHCCFKSPGIFSQIDPSMSQRSSAVLPFAHIYESRVLIRNSVIQRSGHGGISCRYGYLQRHN